MKGGLVLGLVKLRNKDGGSVSWTENGDLGEGTSVHFIIKQITEIQFHLHASYKCPGMRDAYIIHN